MELKINRERPVFQPIPITLTISSLEELLNLCKLANDSKFFSMSNYLDFKQLYMELSGKTEEEFNALVYK